MSEQKTTGVSGTNRPQTGMPRMGWETVLGVALGAMAGSRIGEVVGAGFLGLGAATGTRIGSWIGFFLGAGLGSCVASLLGLIARPENRQVRYFRMIVVINLVILPVLGLCGALGEAFGGAVGGSLAIAMGIAGLIGVFWRLTRRRAS